MRALVADLAPLQGKRVLVLCSAAGEVAIELAQRVGRGEVIGLEYADELLAAAEDARQAHPGLPVRFEKAGMRHILYPRSSFDAVVSEFVVFPTSQATDIGQPEMARVLRPGGVMSITDVIVPEEPPPDVRRRLAAAGLDYLCVASVTDFEVWMKEAGMVDVVVRDITPMVRPVWERRLAGGRRAAVAELLLGGGPWGLGRGLRYVKVSGRRGSATVPELPEASRPGASA